MWMKTRFTVRKAIRGFPVCVGYSLTPLSGGDMVYRTSLVILLRDIIPSIVKTTILRHSLTVFITHRYTSVIY